MHTNTTTEKTYKPVRNPQQAQGATAKAQRKAQEQARAWQRQGKRAEPGSWTH